MSDNSKESYADQFNQYGFIKIPSVLSKKQIIDIRNQAHNIFLEYQREHDCYSYEVRTIPPTKMFCEEHFYGIWRNKKVVDVLTTLFRGELFFIPDLEIHRNLYAAEEEFQINKPFRKIRGPGWHLDTDAQGKKQFLTNSQYLLVKCGIYLQDNTTEVGGGIDVVPGCHRFPLKTPWMDLDYIIRNLRNQLGILFKKQTVDIQAGDLVIFHQHLPHRGTLPKANYERVGDVYQLPDDLAKLVIYFSAAGEAEATRFMSYAAKRASDDLNGRAHNRNIFFGDFVAMDIQKEIPQEVLNELKQKNIQVASSEPRVHAWAQKKRALRIQENYFVNLTRTIHGDLTASM